MLYVYTQVRNAEMNLQMEAKLANPVNIHRIIIKFFILMDRNDLHTISVQKVNFCFYRAMRQPSQRHPV